MSGYVRHLAERAHDAACRIARLDGDTRRRLIGNMADTLSHRRAEVLAANAEDMERGRANGLSEAVLDRLKLDDARIEAMAQGLREVAAQADPLGVVTRRDGRPNGVVVEGERNPLGLRIPESPMATQCSSEEPRAKPAVRSRSTSRM